MAAEPFLSIKNGEGRQAAKRVNTYQYACSHTMPPVFIDTCSMALLPAPLYFIDISQSKIFAYAN